MFFPHKTKTVLEKNHERLPAGGNRRMRRYLWKVILRLLKNGGSTQAAAISSFSTGLEFRRRRLREPAYNMPMRKIGPSPARSIPSIELIL